mgnify:FL=1
MKTNWTKEYTLGKVDGANIRLSAPSWDCGWYWGFGYLGNKNCHYHLSGLGKGENINFKDALAKHFDAGTSIFKHDGLTWTFCELVQTAYSLKETAETLGRGGSHYTTNPLAELIKNPAEVERINKEVLPAIFDAIEQTLKALQEHNEFLASTAGAFIVTDGHYNLTLDLMTWEQVQDYIAHQKRGGFDVSKIKLGKIKRGDVFKTGKGNDLVKYYDLETGDCRVMLCNSIFTKEANEAFEAKIFEYRKAA